MKFSIGVALLLNVSSFQVKHSVAMNETSSNNTYYMEEIPLPMYMGSDCDKYDPQTVDWGQFSQDVIDFLKTPGGDIGPDQVTYKRVASMLVRAAFHDGGSYINGMGGSDGSFALSAAEDLWPQNNVPLNFPPYVRGALFPLVKQYQISWADAIAVASAAATVFLARNSSMYDPMEFIIDVGRCESNIANPPTLPFSNLTLPQFVSYWESIGISFNDGVILMGSHSILEDGTNRIDGVQQYEWSNKYYQDGMLGNTTVTQGFADCLNETGLAAMDDATEDPAAVLWSAGNWQYTINDAFIAPNYAEKKCLTYFESTEEDLSKCPYKDMVKKYRHFARSLVSFNTDYPMALRRLSTINAKYSVKDGAYILEGTNMTLF